MNEKFYKAIEYFIPFAAVITLLYGFIYFIFQQSYRQSANDPQIQIAEDTVTMLNQGYSPQYILNSGSMVDISISLSPFITIYNSKNKSIVTSGILNGRSPEIPIGVFDYARKYKEDRFTWQPQKNVRIAAIVVAYKNNQSGVVLVGRNLREIELRENNLGRFTLLGWIFSLVLLGIIIFIFRKY